MTQPTAHDYAFCLEARGFVAEANELRRLHESEQELLAALKLARSIIGHPDDTHSQHIAAIIAKAEEKYK